MRGPRANCAATGRSHFRLDVDRGRRALAICKFLCAYSDIRGAMNWSLRKVRTRAPGRRAPTPPLTTARAGD
jgi:hypothetical protein